MKKKIIKIILWSGGIIFFLIIVSVLLLYINRDKIKAVIVSELNKQLVTEIKVSSIDVEFFSTFPRASLSLNNVVAFDAFPKNKDSINTKQTKDTLFCFEKVYLTFDIWDILYENYKIENIIANNGSFNMKINKNGDVNYIFWKKSQKKTSSHFSFSLNKIKLNQIKYSYRNDYTKQYYEIFLKEAIAKGNFSDKEQIIIIDSKAQIKKIQIDNLLISSQRDFDFHIDFSNNTISKRIQVRTGELIIDGLNFDVSGHLTYNGIPNISLSVKGHKVKIEEIIKLLPEKYSKLFKDYNSKGELIYNFNMDGIINRTNVPSISSNFNIINGEIRNDKLGIAFTNINLKGSFSNGKNRNSESSYINLDNFSLLWNKGSIKGYAKLYNFSNLTLDAKVDCNLPLDIIHTFIQQKEIKQLSGQLNLNLQLNGDIKSFGNISNNGFSNIKMIGKGDMKSLNYSDTRLPYPINNLSTNFIFDNSTIKIENLNANLGNSSINFNGQVENILPYIFKQRKEFDLNGNLKVGSFKINDWLKSSDKKQNDNSKKGNENLKLNTVSKFGLPTFLNTNIKAEFAKLVYEKTEMNNFKAIIKLYNGNLSLEEMSFLAYGGEIKGKASLIINNKPKVFGDLNLKKIDASKFFYAMNEFGQNSITSKNIKGKVTANISFSAELNNKFEFLKDKLVASLSYKIEEGELKEIPVLKKLSYFVDETALNNVKFGTIESNATIQNSCITIDEINIKSNAINFSMLGKHYLNKNIDYRVKIQLSELSSKKKKAKLEKQKKEFGDIQQDENSRITLFIKIGGTTDKPTFSYDLKKNLERTKEILKSDKQKIVSSIDKDLKLGIQEMKKDKENWKRQEKGEYIIEWEEGKKKDTIKKEDKKDDTKFQIEWE